MNRQAVVPYEHEGPSRLPALKSFYSVVHSDVTLKALKHIVSQETESILTCFKFPLHGFHMYCLLYIESGSLRFFITEGAHILFSYYYGCCLGYRRVFHVKLTFCNCSFDFLQT